MSLIRGNLQIISNDNVEWRVPDLDSPEMAVFSEFHSPEFNISGERWKFLIMPRLFGRRMSVALHRVSRGPHTVHFSVALRTANGQKKYETFRVLFKNEIVCYIDNVLSIEEYKRRKSELCTFGSITIVSGIAILTAENLWEEFNKLRRTYSQLLKEKADFKEELDACKADKESISKEKLNLEGALKATRKNLKSITNELNHLRKKCDDTQLTLERTVKRKVALDVYKADKVTRENWDDKPLCEDFKKVLLNGLNYDLTLKIGDKELRAHQDILRARSQVFKSMLSHDTQEKKSGIIDIPDCDPEAMEQFLCFIYTGRVDSLEESNMLSLYYIADKYDMRGLKEKCSSFIKESISSLNFCKVIQLALNHSDHNLLEHATDYFTDNMLDIMCTVEWQIFMKDNTTVANELTIKSVKKLKTVKM